MQERISNIDGLMKMGGIVVHIVLVEPEIPQNTGNIARTCAATGSSLHLVHPLGFSTEDRYLKRAGLDYWHLVDIHHHRGFQEFAAAYPFGTFYFATTKAKKWYNEFKYDINDFLIFGPETRGLPEKMLEENREHCVRLPMIAGARSLNLSNSVAVLLYESLRQRGFPGMK